MTLTKSLLNWAFNSTSAIDNAMNGTSTKNVPLPGHCFAGIAAPGDGVTALPRPKVKRVATEPPYLVDAQQALLDSLQALTEIGHARLAAEQTFSSAMTAENGQRVVFFRRRWGMAELVVADKSAALGDAYAKAGGQDATVTADDWHTYCQRLKTTGFTAEERSDAHAVGLTDPEIDAILAQKRQLTDADSADPGRYRRDARTQRGDARHRYGLCAPARALGRGRADGVEGRGYRFCKRMSAVVAWRRTTSASASARARDSASHRTSDASRVSKKRAVAGSNRYCGTCCGNLEEARCRGY